MNGDDHDYLDISTPRKDGSGGSKAGLRGPLLALALGVAAAAGIYFAAQGAFARRQDPAPAGNAALGATADDLSKRQITAFVEDFLMAYYNFSYTLYDGSVARAEAMMTPAFQAAYNQRAQDLTFKRKLQSLRVSTDRIKILAGSLAFSNEGERYFVRLAGTMTFTTGTNGASGDFPLTLLLALVKTENGFLVDNVERLR